MHSEIVPIKTYQGIRKNKDFHAFVNTENLAELEQTLQDCDNLNTSSFFVVITKEAL